MFCLRHRYFSLGRCFSTHFPVAFNASRAALSETQPECEVAREKEPPGKSSGRPGALHQYYGKQHLILYGYQGANYYGSALQEGRAQLPTVERELLDALVRVGALSELHGKRGPRRFSRMSRTDRGVSAVGQCCSLTIRTFPGFVEAVNAELPPEVRVFSCQRVVPSLEIRHRTRSRRYTYTMPSFALASAEKPVNYSFRISADELARATALFRMFVGTHNFHNFTPGGDVEDQRMDRHILSARLEAPVVVGGVEFVTLRLHGLSFVMSQIRRMVGVVVAVCRGGAAGDMVARALSHRPVRTTTAPGLGLVLEHGDFNHDAYYWQLHGHPQLEHVQQQMQHFRQTVVLKHIYETEVASQSMLQYVRDVLLRAIGGDRHGHRFSQLGAIDYMLNDTRNTLR